MSPGCSCPGRPGSAAPRAGQLPARHGSSPTTSSPRASTPTTSGSATGSASRAGASPTRTRCWSTWPPTRAPARSRTPGWTPTDIDTVIVATCTMLDHIPNAAAQIAHRIGIPAPAAFDLNAACAGFCYGIAVAADLVRAGTVRARAGDRRREAVRLAGLGRPLDRIIFADGAGAAVVGAAPDAESVGIGPVAWGSAGDLSQTIRINPDTRALHQEGQAVFRWATTQIAPVALRGDRAGRADTRRHRRVRAAPGQPADHRGRRQAAARQGRARRHARRRRHRALGQHLVGLDPAGAGPHARRRAACGPARRCCS